MAEQLKADAVGAPAPGPQNVTITEGQAVTRVQAPTATGNIWFAFAIGAGSATLNVNFNGQNYPNVPPGEYTLSGLSTTLNLDVRLDGSIKLAWVAF